MSKAEKQDALTIGRVKDHQILDIRVVRARAKQGSPGKRVQPVRPVKPAWVRQGRVKADLRRAARDLAAAAPVAAAVAPAVAEAHSDAALRDGTAIISRVTV